MPRIRTHRKLFAEISSDDGQRPMWHLMYFARLPRHVLYSINDKIFLALTQTHQRFIIIMQKTTWTLCFSFRLDLVYALRSDMSGF